MHMRSSPSENMCVCSESFYYETVVFANGTLEEGKQKPKKVVKNQSEFRCFNKQRC